MAIQDSSTAKQNLKRHPWARELVDGWLADVSYTLSKKRDFIESMMPALTPWPEYGQSCPECVGRLSAMGESNLYEWDVRSPDRLTCKYCETVYPNEDYPESGSITARRMGQTFTFYLTDEEKSHPEDRTGRYAFRWVRWPVHTSWSGILRAKKGRWCIDQLAPLSRLYALTGDIACAERAAWIMDAMATRYPDWLFHSYDGTYADCPPAEVPPSLGRYPLGGRFPKDGIVNAFEGRHMMENHAVLFNGFWGAGRFGCSGSDAGIVLQAALSYDLVREATYEDGTKTITSEMDCRIRDDLLLAACEDCEHWNEINNKAGHARSLSAVVGRLFDRPQSVRRAIEGFKAILDKGFHFDGFGTESPSYSDMFLNLVRDIPELVYGYTDPPGYQPHEGNRLEDYDPYLNTPLYRSALEGQIRLLDPNRRYPVIGDTHAGSGLQTIHAEVLTAKYDIGYAGLLEQTLEMPLADAGDEYALWHRDPNLKSHATSPLPVRTEWYPGWHVGVLRGGNCPGHTAFYLNGYGFSSHRHRDTLGIIFLAFNKELASDRGYIWDDPRGAWTRHTLSHNVVTVDGKSQNLESCQATLELFGRGPGIEVIQASADAYKQCDLYRRTCALIRLSGGRFYAVDLFRVTGGRTHHFGFHCNGEMNTPGSGDRNRWTSAENLPEDWSRWVKGSVEAAGLSDDRVTWTCDGVHMDLMLLNPSDRIIIGDAPGWRSCDGNEINAPSVQHLLAEKQVIEGARSDFASVIVPYADGCCPITHAELAHHDLNSGAMVVKVFVEGGTDYIISSPDYAERQYGEIKITGKMGFISTDRHGLLISAYLLDGLRLEYNGLRLRSPRARTSIGVESVNGTTYTLAKELPSEILTKTAYLLAGDTGYDIEKIEGNRVEVKAYPAIECESVTLIHEAAWERQH